MELSRVSWAWEDGGFFGIMQQIVKLSYSVQLGRKKSLQTPIFHPTRKHTCMTRALIQFHIWIYLTSLPADHNSRSSLTTTGLADDSEVRKPTTSQMRRRQFSNKKISLYNLKFCNVFTANKRRRLRMGRDHSPSATPRLIIHFSAYTIDFNTSSHSDGWDW